ncbi:MAG TPA: TlyA family RNA methyltransferase [Caulobacteraceae bacterium]|jgi:23S rRNA (cytidine1920-2'-O)/16S rRNA (cytidine1409-2'-O)-methyltransferase
MSRRLDQLLVERGLFESRAKAREAVEAGLVRVNGRVVLKPAASVAEDASIEAEAAHPWVGRGALKLEHALALWPVTVEGRAALDVGASTGGFTEALLARGARRVWAVDVGRGQLHPRVAADPRVASLEGVDARAVDGSLIEAPVELIVCDASFIGLAKVLPAALALAGPGADLVALVKPQFEVGPERVGKGGLVRDAQARADAVAGVRAWLEGQGWTLQGEAESPIAGGDGNIEHLLWARGPG